MRAAAAVELIHVYSLVHDDLPAMDNDDLRRGRPTCHRAFDEATAILVGDALQARAFEVLAQRAGARSAPTRASKCCASWPTPSARAAWPAARPSTSKPSSRHSSEAALERMHRQKTGALIQASVLLGAISAGLVDAAGARRARGIRRGDRPRLPDPGRHPRRRGHHHALGKRAGADADRVKPTYPSVLGLEAARAQALRAPRSRHCCARRPGARVTRTCASSRISSWRAPAEAMASCSTDARVNFRSQCPLASEAFPLLRSVNLPADLRAQPENRLGEVCDELREYLIQQRRHARRTLRRRASARSSSPSRCTTSSTRRDDRLVWDVGHQAYPHKVLTGRRDRLDTIKQKRRPRAVPVARRKRIRHVRRRPLEHLDQRRARHGGGRGAAAERRPQGGRRSSATAR